MGGRPWGRDAEQKNPDYRHDPQNHGQPLFGVEVNGVVTLVAVGEPQGQDRDCFLAQARPLRHFTVVRLGAFLVVSKHQPLLKQ
ncbi:hypothetical protein NSPZN2_60105 [Nitrospira defluvii]|uniref:Uncharacterized protein n=1 Tax=Nitrospira defluvii TaxID=330214 RepID=A0ABN7MDY0_9BACT|nr:hypothetical protein NSPZN2_60105 [Nitrospira defluvii]